jgi:UDP-N-acetylglucosamine 2-epimerase (non-hydrolysing)/GDP/UDP-N,N'-diacetylbacillosamine 2-epimerase (hydrolysing)
MEAIRKHRDLKLQVVVTGMHLLRKFGHTVDEIIRDGWPVDARIRMQAGDDGPLDQAIGVSRGIAGIARFLEQGRTDIVVVLGDRIEAMAGALAGVTTGRMVAHIHGGDLAAGDFDDSLRHAITKLSHLHLAATRQSQRRIIRMGEAPQRVFCVGAPGLDRLVALTRETPARKERSGQALIVHHACGRSPGYERRVMNALLRAVREAGLVATIIHPNSDRGHSGIIEAIETHRRQQAGKAFEVVRSLDRDTYLRRLIGADVLVGNSSSGIIEAATAGTPAVNIGPRQQGRQRGTRLIVEAGESLSSIKEALRQALRKRPIIGRTTLYGDGCAGGRIARILAEVALGDQLPRKSAGIRQPGRKTGT